MHAVFQDKQKKIPRLFALLSLLGAFPYINDLSTSQTIFFIINLFYTDRILH